MFFHVYYDKLEICVKLYNIEAIVYIVVFLIAAAVIFTIYKLCVLFKDNIKFLTTGLDSKFSLSEIRLLWRVAKICELEQPLSLYWSMPSLTRCISQIKADADEKGKENSADMQRLLSKRY